MNTSKQKIDRIKLKYPNRIPVIVNKSKNSNAPDIDKNIYLVPSDLTLGQFIFVIRKRINLNPEQAIYIFCKDTLPNTSMVMSELYNIYKNSNELLQNTVEPVIIKEEYNVLIQQNKEPNANQDQISKRGIAKKVITKNLKALSFFTLL